MKWTREAALSAVGEWVAKYGEPPRAIDLQPSRLWATGDAEALTRRQETRLPSLNATQRLFGGFDAYLSAAGYPTRGVGRPVGTGRLGPPAPQLHSRARRTWRAAVLARDSYRCQDCGSEDDLEAHHLRPTREDFRRWTDLDNGVTVCRSCHKDRHRSAPSVALG